MDVKVVKIKVLGKGCHGVVHLVKTIAPVYNKVFAMSADEDHYYSIFKEEEILQHFADSPHIVKCHGGFTNIERERGVVYNMFLEYASGGSLVNLMKKNGGKVPKEMSSAIRG
ncbi:mitogen-activated protein kinase kinase kinase 16 [Hibiscus trionum]|uniref:Mitogen-activated protein kinase kinase kinase 16 n=1 Tax=Hibiscus trionum TaxID=183268 RepID=A0A9W7HSQ3_HIBTR|nr:mitogen-activated protein kinase kinase kinase 16 [Hibiscus trionum]